MSESIPHDDDKLSFPNMGLREGKVEDAEEARIQRKIEESEAKAEARRRELGITGKTAATADAHPSDPATRRKVEERLARFEAEQKVAEAQAAEAKAREEQRLQQEEAELQRINAEREAKNREIAAANLKALTVTM